MEILTKLTKRNLKLNKKRAIGTVIGIVLSVALICAVSGMFTSFQETLVRKAINERGYFHIALSTINKEELNKLKLNNDIKNISLLYELGQSTYINSNEDNPYITVYSINKDDFDNLSYTLVEGRFPKNSTEIVISKKMALYSKIKVGDYVELNLGERKTIDDYDLDDNNPYFVKDKEYIANPQYKKYKVVGISYRERNNNSIYGITTQEKNENIHAYIELKNPKDYKQSFVELLNVSSYDDIEFGRVTNNNYEYTINNELLRWQAFAFSDSTISALSAIVSVVVAIIIIVSVFCIRNSFAISTTEKMKMFGMLASVGATKKQIKKSVILEGLILGLIAIPIGIIFGILAVFILVKVVNVLLGDMLFNGGDGVVFKVTLLPILISTILGFVTIYLSSISSAKRASHVSPIDNLRNTKDIKLTSKSLKTPKIIRNIFKTGGVLAYKNLKRSKKKYRTTVISLTVSIFAFITMSAFITEGFRQAGLYYQDLKYNVIIQNGIKDYDEVEINNLKELNNVNKSYLLYEDLGITSVEDESKIINYPDSDLSETSSLTVNIMGLDDYSFREYAKDLGLKYDNIKDKGILIDDFRYWSNTKQKEIITKRYSYIADDIMNLEYKVNEEIRNLSIELADVTTKRPAGLENYYFGGGFLILNKDYYKDLDFYPYRLMFESDNPETLVNDVQIYDEEIVIRDLHKDAESERTVVKVMSIFLYGFIIVITLIGVTNIFNTITSNMELRQKEFAMLKSVGMTKKEFNRMINLETLFYSAKSLFYGSILGIFGSYLIYLAFSKKIEMPYQFPITSILICVVFVFILVYVIMKYSINKINKQNTIETIRKENI